MADSRPPSTLSFTDLGLPSAVVDALAGEGITEPFPIQAATLPHALAGRDVLGRGRTGSGKTYGFLLPLVTRLSQPGAARRPKQPRGLILVPTRELATQIDTALAPLARATGLRSTTVFGGVSAGRQIEALRRGVDIVIACPGRLTDLMQQGAVDLGGVAITVLDEADHMADLGFLPGVRRLMDQTPRNGQRLMFSATLDNAVDVLVKRFLSDPVVHSVDTAQSPVTNMEHHVLEVDTVARLKVISDLAAAPGRTVIFTRTKHGAKALSRKLNATGVPAVELHGNLSQNARARNLATFSNGSTGTLVATDIAARGIHVDDVSLVIHADPPTEHKAYLHRSGRTARAGAAGTVVTIVLDHQRAEVRAMTKKAGISATRTRVDGAHPLLRTIAPGERTYADAATIAAMMPNLPNQPGTRSGGGRSGGGAGGGRSRRSGGGSSTRTASPAGAGSSSGARSGGGRPRRGGSAGGGSSTRGTTGGGSHSAASFSGNRSRGR
jgi:superfamily II DNA/RNA helicase